MKVFKFGGASVKDANGIRNVGDIIRRFGSENLLIIISASGKTTNNLEDVVNAYFKGEGAEEALERVKAYHYQIVEELFGSREHSVADALNDIFVEIEWIIEEKPSETYDYVYDQIVSTGEFLSTKIVAAYLNEQGARTTWLDARDVIRTDNTYREGKVDWAETQDRMTQVALPLLKQGLVITQGFIGCTSENFTTTLGREGSDYTAAICSFCLNAESMSIWKDVSGVLTADPRLFTNTTKLDRLSYREAIEMTYYGAQIIHPKTIQPIQNKNIPLYVKSFIDPTADGTVISGDADGEDYPPMIVVKKNQAILHISSRNFSFIAEDHLSDIFALLAKYRVSVNMMQNTAISFSVCVTNDSKRVEAALAALEEQFNTRQETNLELITVRYFQPSVLEMVKKDKIVVMEDYLRNTAQVVVRNLPKMERIAL